ncbi:Zinc finger, U1-type [Corchorus olitorius]|uniref:Zinc finger, U1-type n=1 Tax=Corchorus olitorius TaxID=93759 RepID=A0A1R3KCK0_9ROSI|nr:Zinc finger, U1-type [Corchorus olitorius]
MGEEEMTISVELALQREMEYRRKINGKTLQLLPFDSGDEILPVQVKFPSPNPPEQNLNITPRPCGREQLPPPSNPGCLPSSAPSRNPFSRPNISSGPRIFERKQQLGSSSNIPPPQQLQAFKNLNHPSNYFCKDCQVPCSGYLNYKQHINGKMHKAKLQALKLDRKDGGGASNSTVANEKPYCKLCNVWCSDLNLLRQHLLGQKHKKMQAKLGEIAVEQNRCQLCGIECNSKELLQAHYDGKKHQAELRKLEYAQKGSEEAQNRPKRCKVCDVQCADKDSLQRHLMERKHFLHDVDVKKKTVAR